MRPRRHLRFPLPRTANCRPYGAVVICRGRSPDRPVNAAAWQGRRHEGMPPYGVLHTKNRLAFASRLSVLALPIFLCRQSIVPPMAGSDVLSMICKKSACRWQADFLCWRYLSSRAVTRKVLSAKVSLTSVFGMGTGGPSPQSTPTASKQIPYPSPRSKAQGSVTPLLLLSNAKLVLHWVLRDVP